MAKLGEVFKCQITGEWGKECSENEGGIKVLRTTNFTSDGVINYTNVVERNISESKVEKKKLQFEDIILEKSGGTEKTPVGRVVYCDKTIENDVYLCNNFTQAMRVNKQIALPRYIFYYMWFCHYSGKTELLQNKTTGIRNLQVKAYMNEEIELPNLEQQKKIVDKLDKIADCVNNRKSQLEKLDELVKSRFIEMFGDLPEEAFVTMEDVCKIITDGTHQPPKFVSEGIPFLFVSNIVTNEITYNAEKFITPETYAELIKRTPIEVGDILLSTVGSYGHPAIVKSDKLFCFQRHIAYLKLNMNVVNSEYVKGAILSFDVQRQIDERVKGIAQKTLNLSEIRKLRIPLPPLDLQNQFADFVAQVDKSKLAVQKSLEQLEILKKSLMQAYFG